MRYIVFVLALLTSMSTWSQELDFVFRGKVENQDLGKSESGVTVSIVQGSSTIASTSTASNGKYNLVGHLNYGTPFEVVFSKGGLVSKRVKFDLSKMNVEDIPPGNEFKPIEALDMTMFKERENVDFSFLNTQPVGTFDWNTRGMSVRLDEVEKNRVQNQILELLAKADKDKAAAEAGYQAAIAAADKFYNEKNYEEALSKYEEALSFKPQEKYPSDRIVELDALIQAQKQADLAQEQADAAYNNLIKAGDNLRDQGNLEGAIAKYTEALTKKNEQYPRDQIEALEIALENKRKEAENEAQYQETIKRADAFLKQNSIRAARDAYEQASKLKPSEQYPKDKLAELAKKLEEVAAREEQKKKYDEAVAAADMMFNAEDFEGAKEKYEEALAIESASTYVKGRIGICDEKIAAAQAKKERLAKIEELINNGNKLIQAKDWEPAKASFTEVLTLDAENAIAKERIAFIDQKIEEANNLALQEENFNKLVAEGDKADAADDLATALAKYQEAKTIKTTPELETKIAAVQAKIADKEAYASKRAEYDKLVQEGEMLMSNGVLGSADLPKAKEKFTQALALFPEEKLPKDKIVEIDGLLGKQAEETERKANYDKAISEADHLFNEAKWEDAKKKYREAMTFDNTQTYPNERIAAIDKKIAEEAEQNKQKADYDAAIADADKQFGQGNLEAAKDKYNAALKIDNTQAYPIERIAAIDALLKEQADKESLAAQYDQAIKDGDRLFSEDKLEAAKSKFEEALGLDPSQNYPKQKIEEINGLIAAKMAENDKKAAYDAAIAAADDLFSNGNLQGAKGKYNEAKAIDASQAYPVERIAEIDKLLAEQSEEQAKKAAYDAAIAAADDLFNSNDWNAAMAKYQEAIGIDNSQSYPSERIAAIDKKLAELANANAVQQQIAALLQEGNTLLGQEKYKEAKAKYTEVLSLEAGHPEATSKLDQINAALAALENEAEREARFAELKKEGFKRATNKDYNGAVEKLREALTIKNDAETEAKLNEVNAILAANDKDQQYNDLINEAATLASSEQYEKAIAKYREAGNLKPSETLPPQKISEIEALLAKSSEQAKLDAEYRALMDRGDELVRQEKYLDAIKEYNAALALKPTEQEPVDKAAEAERLEKSKKSEVDVQYEKILTVAQKKIDEQDFTKAIELLERAKKLKPTDSRPDIMLADIEELQRVQAQYDALISNANSLADSKQYEEAKSKYQAALSVKPTEQLPKDKIVEMDRLIANRANAAQKEALYKEYMTKGQSSQDSKSYEMALSHYQNALSVKEGDIKAQNKIDEIQQILDDIANNKKKDLQLQIDFDRFIKEADGQFAVEDYLGAKQNYEAALRIDPSSSYAKVQVDECIRLERERTREQAEREYRKIIEAGDKYFDLETYDKAKGYYSRALTLKRDDPYPKKKLEEIEAILNPITTSSAELEDLGIPYNGSILDGALALQQAEEQRKALKKSTIEAKYERIHADEIATSMRKQQEHYDDSRDIFQVYQRISLDGGMYDDDRKEIVELIKQSEYKRANAERDNAQFDHDENVGNQGTIYNIKQETSLEYGERESVYAENTEKMNAYNTKQAEIVSKQARDDYGANIRTDQELTDVKIKIDQGVRDDYAERAEVERDVVKAHRYAMDESSRRLNDRYNEQLENQDALTDVAIAVQNKSVIDSEKPHNNNNDLTNVRAEVIKQNMDQNSTETATAYEADAEIAAVKRKVRADGLEFDENRKASNEVLKQSKKELAEAQEGMAEDEHEKYLTNKQVINNEVKVNEEIKEIEKEAHDKKVAYVDKMDKRARVQTQAGLEGDEEERLQARKSIESITAKVSDDTGEAIKKHEESNEALVDLNKSIDAQERANAQGQQDKHYDAQDKLNNVSNAPVEKPKVANELGGEYPEGVSQESFTRSDENGLMTTIITRRIVVIDGHADVYVRTQTLNGITYSKNGKPSLSHVWNRETQDPKLERHF